MSLPGLSIGINLKEYWVSSQGEQEINIKNKAKRDIIFLLMIKYFVSILFHKNDCFKVVKKHPVKILTGCYSLLRIAFFNMIFYFLF
jgi:hypothetical protein